MKLTLSTAAVQLTKKYDNPIKLSPIYRKEKTSDWLRKTKSTKYWVVAQNIEIVLSDGLFIVIPRGFETDLSSTPKWLWGVVPPYGDFLLAALIHDYLYVMKLRDRKYADFEMLIWSRALNNDTWLQRLDNEIRYVFVRWFGRWVWRRGIKNQFNPA